MSEKLTAAAAALGLPESLVQRSADARAAETGASADDLLTEWAGGEPAPVAAPNESVEEETPISPPPSQDEPVAVEPEVESAPPPSAPPEPVVTGPYVPPVLVDAKDSPLVILAGVIGLFIVVVLVGLVGPSIPADEAGSRTSEIAYSGAGEDGQHIYRSLGCASCHTQMVRPIVADVGLGAVSLNDTNQVIGTRRFGPDLSNIGGRMTASQIEATIGGLGEHPAHTLSNDDMSDLVAYLAESVAGGS